MDASGQDSPSSPAPWWHAPELRAAMWAINAVGAVMTVVAVVRWLVSGSPLDALAPLLPVVGAVVLALWLVGAVLVLVLAKGQEKLVGLSGIIPALLMLTGVSYARVGGLVLAFSAMSLVGGFVGLFRR